ncbi:hypothetical protein CLFE_029520 [Clostridium felsineum DSM 794]|nr:hypothetical protein CLFE_029520 [Clostridium felsineum DSM 794]
MRCINRTCASNDPEYNSKCDQCTNGSHYTEVKRCTVCGEKILTDYYSYYISEDTGEIYCSVECALKAGHVSLVD